MKPRKARLLRIEPLTHCGRDGKVYTRTPEVKDQIREALSLERAVLCERVAIERYTTPGFIKEECLVYLIRRFLRAGESELASHLINCLANRIARRVHSRVSASLDWSLVDDSAQEVMIEVARRITDLTSDRDDFAQSRFGLWLERVTYNAIRPDKRTQKITRVKRADIEEVEQSNGKKKPLTEGPISPEQILVNAEAQQRREEKAERLLEQLDPEVREAYILRNRDGMEIENKDPDVMTISKHFGRDPRTIRNWLKGAQEKLQELQGGQQ